MIAAVAVVVFAVVAIGAFAARPLFDLPAPTGPYPVGTVTRTLNRPIEPREVSPGQFDVQIWYPALASADRAPYGTGAGGIRQHFYHTFVRTHSARNAVPAPRRSPIIVYVPAWGGQRTENTALAEELASQGYVVAAIDDVTRDSPVLDRLAGTLDLRSDRAYHATLELANRRLAYETQRASAVLDYLTKLDAGDPDGTFTGRLDLHHVGILGYSFGGAVALEACRNDKRFSAAMNLDGILFGASAGYNGGVPYFLVSDVTPLPTANDLASENPAVRNWAKILARDTLEQTAVLHHGGYELEVANTVHASFNDAPLYAPLQRFRAGWDNPPHITAALREYALAFFGKTLYGTPSPLLTPGTRGSLPTMTLAVGAPVMSP